MTSHFSLEASDPHEFVDAQVKMLAKTTRSK
jgi:hypothetical protein